MIEEAAANPSPDISSTPDSHPRSEQLREPVDVGQPEQAASEAPTVMLAKMSYHTNEVVKPRSELGPIQEMPRVQHPMVIPPFHPNEISEHPIRPVFEKWQIPSHQHAALDKYIKGKFENSDIVPPKNTLFHEALGNYVQRWAVWISEIEDRDRRDQLLVWVMEKMENIWRYGIDHGLYPRVGDPRLDEHGRLREHGTTTGFREKPGKRVKKNDDTLVLEDEILPRQIENAKTPFKITREEFVAAGGNTDSLNTRIALRDVQGGEALFQAEADRLGGKLNINDWRCVRDGSNRFGRVLWLYCLHEVQVAKEEVKKLRRIMKNMTAPNQKKNTNRRMADEMNRINHWLAMALELHPEWMEAQQRINTNDEGEEEGSKDEDSKEGHIIHTAQNPHEILTDQADHEMVDSSQRQTPAGASKPVAVAEQADDCLAPLVATAKQAPLIDPSYSTSQQDITTPAPISLGILVANLDTTKSKTAGRQAVDEAVVNTTLKIPRVEAEAIDMDDHSQCPQRRIAKAQQCEKPTFNEVPRTAQRPVVLKLTHSAKNKQSTRAKRRKREQGSDEEWQDEEKVIDTKKRRASNGQEQQVQTTKQDKVRVRYSQPPLTPQLTTAASPSAVSSPGAQTKHELPNLSEEDQARHHSYLLKVFIPKINQMLGGPELERLRIAPRKWDVISDKLAAASVPVEVRNQLMRDFCSGFSEEQRGGALEQTTTLTTKDAAGTLESPRPASQKDETASAGQPTAQPTLSKLVTVKTFHNFDPALYSPNHVGRISGFRYRFTAQSSLRDRRACQAFIMKHIFEGSSERMHGKYQPFHIEREKGGRDLIGQGYWDEIDGEVAKDGHWLLGNDDGLASDNGIQRQGGDSDELEEQHINDEDPLGFLD